MELEFIREMRKTTMKVKDWIIYISYLGIIYLDGKEFGLKEDLLDCELLISYAEVSDSGVLYIYTV